MVQNGEISGEGESKKSHQDKKRDKETLKRPRGERKRAVKGSKEPFLLTQSLIPILTAPQYLL